VSKSGFQLRLFGESAESLISAGATPEVADSILGFNSKFLFLNLSDSPEISKPSLIWLIPILACLLQLAVSYVSIRQQKANGQSGANQMGCMLYGMSIFSLVLCFSFPAGMGIYWISSSLIMLIQQVLVNKFYGPGRIAAQLMVDETIYRRSYEKTKKYGKDTDIAE
jgi:YidC/Oxa1 family membrane protein insertase